MSQTSVATQIWSDAAYVHAPKRVTQDGSAGLSERKYEQQQMQCTLKGVVGNGHVRGAD